MVFVMIVLWVILRMEIYVSNVTLSVLVVLGQLIIAKVAYKI